MATAPGRHSNKYPNCVNALRCTLFIQTFQMSKKLRTEPIYIAPGIFGWLDNNNTPHVLDEITDEELDPYNIDDKIIIYERQVKEWFLNPATTLSTQKNKGFIVLMICLSYIEGIEQYRTGLSSNGHSSAFFISSLQRIYPGQFTNDQLRSLYKQARCGLFHNGMVEGKMIINNGFHRSLEFIGNRDIKISPSKFLRDIKNDFEAYLLELNTNQQSRQRFSQMYSNV